jgi:FkbM family methyltransferase
MKDFISYFFKGLYHFTVDSNYRTLVKLFLQNVFKKRHVSSTATFNGFKINVTDFKSFIFQYEEIFFHHFYEFKTASAKPVIYDCGANIGVSTLFFASKFPSARIVSYEPSPIVFEVLKKNISQNNITNVMLNQQAVWVKTEVLQFSEEGADSGSLYDVSNTKKINVQAVDFLEVLMKEEHIDFIKMDIEGAENDLIPHLEPAFSKIQNIFIEYHSFNNSAQRLDEILKLLRNANFRYFIRHGNYRNRPFVNRSEQKDMDMQLNIFAYK